MRKLNIQYEKVSSLDLKKREHTQLVSLRIHTKPRSMGQSKNSWHISHAVGMLIIVSWNIWPEID